MRRAATGFRSSAPDLDAAVRRHPDATLENDTSLVDAAHQASTGLLCALIGLVDRIPAGHRAMRLQTYAFSGTSAQ